MKKEFPLYLPYNDRTYAIYGYIDDVDKYVDNKGYIDETGRIFIYAEDKPVHNDVPYFKIVDNKMCKVDKASPQTREIFRDAYLYDLSYKSISDNTADGEELYDEKALEDMNSAQSLFIPTINATDDCLKKLIKQAIISKQIDLNRLKHRMPQKYGLTNLKSALMGKTKMSVPNFNVWCELLGLSYEITIHDDGSDNESPLKQTLHYTNTTDSIIEDK